VTVTVRVDCTNPLDLVFLVDDSSSIREPEWPEVQGFLRSVADRFRISRDETRIGIVRYATRADIIYRLTSAQTSGAVRSAINRMAHLGGSTNLAEALAQAFQNVFLPAQRPGAARVTQTLPSLACLHFAAATNWNLFVCE